MRRICCIIMLFLCFVLQGCVVDDNFAYNYSEARKTGLRVGAYHFFSYDSEGSTQADNFIETVENFEGMLPPVIDLEFYGDKRQKKRKERTKR